MREAAEHGLTQQMVEDLVTAADWRLAVSLKTRLNERYVMESRAREGARVHILTAELEEATAEALERQVEEAAARFEAARAAESKDAHDRVDDPPPPGRGGATIGGEA